MFWLVLQILFYLLAAAFVGAWLAWWWFRRRYEDITERYSAMERDRKEMSGGLSVVDLDDRLAAQFGALNMPDLVPVEERLRDVERAVSGIAIPDPDLAPVLERLEMVEAHLTGSDPDIEALNTRLGRLEGALASVSSNVQALDMPDLESLEYQVQELRKDIRKSEGVDLRPFTKRFDLLSEQFAASQAPDIAPISQSVSELSASIREKQWVDLRPLEARMARLEGAIQSAEPPELDLGPLHSGLARLELLIETLKASEPDLAPVHGQLDHVIETLAEIRQGVSTSGAAEFDAVSGQLTAMSSTLATMQMPDLGPLRDRLSVIERSLGQLALPETDLTPLHQQLDRVETLVRAGPDLDVLQSRLISLESAVATAGRGTFDLEPVHRQLELIKAHLLTPNQNVDMLHARVSGMADSLASIEASVGALRSQAGPGQGLELVERRLAALQDAFLGLRQPDLTPVLGQIRAMDSRLDFGAVESRLTAIEYSLAAVHQMLRSRDDGPAPAPPPVYTAPPQQVDTRSWQSAPITPPSAIREYRPAPEPPVYTPDPIQAERRPDDRANLLVRPAFGTPDDLERISGVGPKLRDMLHGIGVYYYWQVAEWTPDNVEWVDSLLDSFNGRIERDNWVSQARLFAAEPTAVRRPG